MCIADPICRVLTSHGLKIATSTHYAAKHRAPSARSVRDTELRRQLGRVHTDDFGVYGTRKVRRQLHHEGIPVACRTISRLMRDFGLQSVRRGKKIRTTIRDDGQERAGDLLRRDVTASRPNQCWVADFIYVATWSGSSLRSGPSRPTSTRPTTTVDTDPKRRLEPTHRASTDPVAVHGPGAWNRAVAAPGWTEHLRFSVWC
ncbi:IS3 family transposase [Streptomyces sp. NPDC085927]|uniref:IS3 family transposase n=1 Tax=Streptomyces sp. NPDC085927 TaxID=3365738 RepID=UPI0037D6B846